MCNYFKEAQRIAKELRGSFVNDKNKLTELRHIEQVAEHNGIALNLVSRLGSLDPSLKVSFEFNHNPYFESCCQEILILIFLLFIFFLEIRLFSSFSNRL